MKCWSLDFCESIGNKTEISVALKWKSNLILFVKDNPNDGVSTHYRLVDFQWDGTQLTFKTIEQLSWDWDIKLKLMFTVDYPRSGQRIVGIGLKQVLTLRTFALIDIHCMPKEPGFDYFLVCKSHSNQ